MITKLRLYIAKHRKKTDFVTLMTDPAYKKEKERLFSDAVSGANKEQRNLVEQAQKL